MDDKDAVVEDEAASGSCRLERRSTRAHLPMRADARRRSEIEFIRAPFC